MFGPPVALCNRSNIVFKKYGLLV